MMKTIFFACGGTGGHVFPAVAVAEAIRNLDSSLGIVFVGRAAPSMEERLLSSKYDYRQIKAVPLARNSIIKNLFLPFSLLSCVLGAAKLLKNEKPEFIVGTGGYVALPIMLAAILKRIPFYIIEPNAVMGVANKICAKFAKKNYIASPVREMPQNLPPPEAFADSSKFRILITGGSQGALGINRKIEQIRDKISANENLSIVWQVGAKNLTQYSGAKNICVTAFLDNIYAYMQHADLIISRSGASTLAEILAFGKAAVFLPFPYATANHQEHNARAIEKEGAAFVELDREENALWEKITDLMNNKEKLESMSKKARELGELNRRAAGKIAEDICST
ncbi:MAG: UDP-N-acetylglucosamine--N-acetylmuramyl-(pentapeptide) pyrophosphoryl-undecaprenol N-acetylglucosamine transferase [Fibromonadaceae bacterium]|jgi:UDP-N-acetylglucosamine--N-acetylmuramyl-(pentapeptide) pyrophosphoryl-undecaprenol N-acetylglucosamine transferase|nr:UDP-N-acetylglucosamine--N-acetylmuramyl-(pentapeptide) pyrophosphoryl-undecaprenol N-acetylglucosamine transferase [Fibromonadaceae bacterium]